MSGRGFLRVVCAAVLALGALGAGSTRAQAQAEAQAHAEGAAACGVETPCVVVEAGETLGTYLLRRPAGGGDAARAPAILFIHGWRSSAQNVMRVRGLRDFADEIGAVIIAPQGLGQTWSYPGSPSQRRDEFAFFDALRRDVIARRGVDPERILLSGFSMGGSMVWHLACRAGDDYWAFAPFAGAFWSPLPEACPAPPRRLRHVHGTSDRTVPLEGRALGGGYRQRGVEESRERLLEGLALRQEPQTQDAFGMRCASWSGSERRLFEVCLHDGGHVWRPSWLRAAWERFETE